MRTIDADGLLDGLYDLKYTKGSPSIILAPAGQEIYNAGVESAIGAVLEAPTIDAVPVVHAKWDEYENTIVCKACGEKWSIRDDGDYVIIEAKEDLKYCPSCGAKMDV